ncbi:MULTISPECIES: DUF6106 family protein [unclassified Ruminococcus]|uniref:DUF6106 family protein n=1 Tax=unclassified Ruminococcus TaxID=2608920 RepID=UPI002109C669|nr:MULTISPECIES: DUF6106 family protein [unclassified Ruminococcus]MCQ4021487.1 hypothetical protein [Ruminococcus sp. zg-924]MCQ4113932.1 hypothetical protein [Ruminococcus sp. zg-921]
MDTMVEQVVKKKKDKKDLLIKIITISALILIPFTCFMLAPIINFYFIMIGFFLLLGGIYVAWFIFSNLKVEYEYSFVSGSMTISKIMSKRKRKNIICFETSKIEELIEYDNRDFDTRLYSHIYSACGVDSTDYKTYAAVITTEKHGRSVLLFTPNEKLLQAMKPHLPRQIVVNLFYKR